jgi:hypothetical protein
MGTFRRIRRGVATRPRRDTLSGRADGPAASAAAVRRHLFKGTSMHRIVWLAATLAALTALSSASAYPLDAANQTGIERLEAYRLAQVPLLDRGTLKPGSLLESDQIVLALTGPGFSLPAPDPTFTEEIRTLLGSDARAYGISVLDITDPAHPRLAEINGNKSQNPGSVGKVMVALGVFQALADVYPDDIAARRRVLYDTRITASDFIVRDTHDVPVYKTGDPKVVRRPIEIGDTANLWTWMDWMMSASSNAAASQVISELLLLREFGADYPPSPAQRAAYFENTSKRDLTRALRDAIQRPLDRNGLDPGKMRQGSLFTRQGKQRVPGATSYATSHELLRYMVLLEQGKLVDPFSSLEIKKLLYLTDIRIRYAASPALNGSAVYFKSGSLYSCKPEKGYECGKYRGNKWNFLNSVTLVEDHSKQPVVRYIAVVLSNVLKKNSAEDHQRLATEIHQLIERLHAGDGSSL